MADPVPIYKDENIRVEAIQVDHYHFPENSPQAEFSRSYAFRAEAGGRTFVFSGDTGFSEALIRLAKDADVLIVEVIDLKKVEDLLHKSPGFKENQIPGMMQHMIRNHVTGSQIGQMAKAANVHSVVLTHFSPGMDGEANPDSYLAGISDYYDGPLYLASDLDSF